MFATVTRNAANVRTMGTTNCLDILNTGYICEADTVSCISNSYSNLLLFNQIRYNTIVDFN